MEHVVLDRRLEPRGLIHRQLLLERVRAECAGADDQRGVERAQKQQHLRSRGQAHVRAPPQLLPAPAVQPKQWLPVAMPAPASVAGSRSQR